MIYQNLDYTQTQKIVDERRSQPIKAQYINNNCKIIQQWP